MKIRKMPDLMKALTFILATIRIPVNAFKLGENTGLSAFGGYAILQLIP